MVMATDGEKTDFAGRNAGNNFGKPARQKVYKGTGVGPNCLISDKPGNKAVSALATCNCAGGKECQACSA